MTRINFLIIHGAGGSPGINWFPWLQSRLRQQGHNVVVPAFPTPEGQSFAAWREIALRELEKFDPADTILIGHSTGAVCVLRLAEIASLPFRAVFSVCPFVRDLGLAPYDALNKTFVHHVFDWPRIKRSPLFCFAGDNDPYVPLDYSREVAKLAGADLTTIAKGGHLNAESGYLEFPLLLDKIRHIIGA